MNSITSVVIPDFEALQLSLEQAEVSKTEAEISKKAAEVVLRAATQKFEQAEAVPTELIDDWSQALEVAPALYLTSFVLDKSFPSKRLDTLSLLHTRGVQIVTLDEALRTQPRPVLEIKSNKLDVSLNRLQTVHAILAKTDPKQPLEVAAETEFDATNGAKTTIPYALLLNLKQTHTIRSATYGFDDEVWLEGEPRLEDKPKDQRRLFGSEDFHVLEWDNIECNFTGYQEMIESNQYSQVPRYPSAIYIGSTAIKLAVEALQPEFSRDTQRRDLEVDYQAFEALEELVSTL